MLQSPIGWKGITTTWNLIACDVPECDKEFYDRCSDYKDHNLCKEHVENCPLCAEEKKLNGEYPDDNPPKKIPLLYDIYHGLEDENDDSKLCEVEDCEKQSIEECEEGHHLCTEHIIDCPICFT